MEEILKQMENNYNEFIKSYDELLQDFNKTGDHIPEIEVTK